MIRRSRTLAGLYALVTVILLMQPAGAQPARPGTLPPLDAATRAAIVDSITAVIDSVYVLAEPAQDIIAGLRKNLADGDYDDVNDPVDFAERLYEDAQGIHHDGHFRILALPPLDPERVDPERGEDPAEVERERRLDRASNYGFRELKVLPGGVGFLRFDRFSHGDEAFAAAAAAMNFLANCSAVIIDVRQNGGGSASMIRFICGYLFDESTHLINWDVRARNETEQSHSPDYVPGRRLVDQPVYVLTSGNTFSAAEEFTFDLKNLERATIVGDTTGGGGHTVRGYAFDFDDFRIFMRVPFGRAYNPKNNEGWEGVGVIPDIAVPASEALDTAHADALRNLIADEEDDVIRARLDWALKGVEARQNPVEVRREQLEDYVGRYGPRRIFFDGEDLSYQREGRPVYRLQPLGDDLFLVVDLDYFRLLFERDGDGNVVRIVGLYDNGERDSNERDPD